MRRVRARSAWPLLSAVMAVLAAPVTGGAGSLRPSHLFGDHMVLQRDTPLPVWGTAAPGLSVSVALAGRIAAATADSAGNWRVTLDPLPAGGPYRMTLAADTTLTLDDVMVGEVWLCGGQSNMEFTVRDAAGAAPEIAAADRPAIRQLFVPHRSAPSPHPDLNAFWTVCTPQGVPRFTAVGYAFGRELHEALGVPIGLIDAAVGGTPIQRWMSREALESDPRTRPIVEESDRKLAAESEAMARYQAAREEFVARLAGLSPAERARARPPIEPKTSFDPPCQLYNGMIAPLIPFPIRGIIWYQGENNTADPDLYRVLFPALIKSWRAAWGRGDFPFLYVQLANYQPRPDQEGLGHWAALREAQEEALALPNTGMAVAIDVGESHDIHPKDKFTVGKRLARLAEAMVHGRNTPAQSPRFAAMRIEGSDARISFTGTERGLVARGGKIRGFEVAGADSHFVPATARLDGREVVVSAAEVAQPVAVRYGWADDPVVNLFSRDGLPVAPFRTDRPRRPVR